MAWFYNLIFTKNFRIGLVAPKKRIEIPRSAHRISQLHAHFHPIFSPVFAHPLLSPSATHVPKNAVLSAFFEDLKLRAAYRKITKRTFSVYFTGMACSLCRFLGSKKDNLACTRTVAFPQHGPVAARLCVVRYTVCLIATCRAQPETFFMRNVPPDEYAGAITYLERRGHRVKSLGSFEATDPGAPCTEIDGKLMNAEQVVNLAVEKGWALP